jgi:addiction module RelE/StbE family toxin
MKPIYRHRQFEKAFKKRIGDDQKLRMKFEARLSLFQSGERDEPLNDHALTGNMAGRRAFSVAGDMRVIYEETDDTITFLDIGSHNQVY